MKTRSLLLALLAGACALLHPALARGQEAMYTAAATLPSPGVFVVRQQTHFWSYGADPVSGAKGVQKIEAQHTVQYGLLKNVSLTLDAPLETRFIHTRDEGTNTQTLLGDVDLMLKWRIYQSDTGGVDTQRFALLAGTRLRTDEQFGVDPHLGAVYTQVWGVHGLNVEAHYTFNTLESPREFNTGNEGDADALALNLAYVLRVLPSRYTSESQAALYLTSEVNTLYETNGDWEVRFSPGLMYEGRRWGFEIMGQLPIYQRVRHRAELDWGVGVGWGVLF